MKIMNRYLLIFVFYFFISIAYASTDSQSNSGNILFPGETMEQTSTGFPALVKFTLGDKNKPLIVFIPGYGFLARISYGYPGGQDQDFIAYWFSKEKYSFLAISYPIEHPVFDKVYPTFSIQDWGKLTAELAQKYISQNHLSNKVIFLGWSIGGKTAQAVNAAAKKAGLDVIMFVSLDGLAPAPNLFAGSSDFIKMKPNGMVDFSFANDLFFKSMAIQDKINNHIIISPTNLQKYFIGSPSLNIQGETLRYSNAKTNLALEDTLKDSGTFEFEKFPFVAILHGSMPIDFPHITINSNWNFFMGQKLYRDYILPNISSIMNCSQSEWDNIVKLFNAYNNNFSASIEGTHFFFVGEKGAKQTSFLVIDFQNKLNNFQKQLINSINQCSDR